MNKDQRKLKDAFFLHQQGKLVEAADIYEQLIQQNPNNYDALHFLGTIKASFGRFTEARQLIERSLATKQTNIAYIENYVAILFQTGDYEQAAQICSKTIKENRKTENLQYVLAISLYKLGRLEEALFEFDSLLLSYPTNLAGNNEKASVLAELKQYDEALSYVEKALRINPRYAEALLNKGNILAKLKKYDESIIAYKEALSLNRNLADAHLGRGNVFVELKRYDEAFADYDKALALKSDLENAWLGRGNTFFDLRRYDEAFADYDKALALKPNLPEAWLGRGNVFDRLNRHEEAANAYAEVLKIDPQHPFSKGMLLHQKMLSCDWKGIEDLIAEINNDVASGKRSARPFGYQAIAHSARDFKRCAEIFAVDQFPRSQTPLWRGERYNNSKIRVGYLSGEFRNHTTSWLITNLFELHDKNRFEIFAFDNGWDDGSELRRRINKAFNTVVDISRLDDLQVATIIKQKQIDLLVNLNGYFGEHRTRVFSYKPSPIQVSYLGFSATMGTDYIDYIIADKYVIPPECKPFYTESVVYLPDTYQVSDTKREIAMRTPARAELKLPATGFIFCCFNNNFKITSEIFDVWMRLLRKVDDSVLWLLEKNPAVSRNLREAAKYRNVAPERLVFSPYTKEYSDYLARYRVADLFLDTLPFNAGATASDALWAGLPLLTCSGQTYTARMAGSLLNAIKLPELIATTLESYEQMAIDLATHPEKLAVIKRKLAENRLTTPLFDTKLFTKHIEAAYTMMYERHQASLAPDHIIVPN